MSERLGRGELIAGIAGLVLILTMFLFAWYGVDGARGGDAFDVFDDWVNIILVFTSFFAMALAFFGAGMARADVPLSVIVTVLGAVSAVIVLIYLISPPGVSVSGGGVEIGIDFGRKLGVWLGFASTIAIALGGYMAMQEEGIDFGSTADRLGGSAGGGQPPTAPPQPPPAGSQPPPPPPPQQPPGA